MTTSEPSPAADQSNERQTQPNWGVGIALGVAMGLSIGMGMDNLIMGIAIGIALGIAMAYASGKKPAEKKDDTDQ